MYPRNKPLSGKHGNLVGAIDQGTSSTRFLIFAAETGEVITFHQLELDQICPKEGWVEQDPKKILESVYTCIERTIENLRTLEIDPSDIKAVGISNQRETVVVWDKITGQPYYNAILWLDTRTITTVEKILKRTPGQNKDYFKEDCGLPISTYFSAIKLIWLLENVEEVREAKENGRLLFGNIDSWLLWNFTGGPNGGLHYTDVTNASRTLLMNLRTLNWDVSLCKFFDVPVSILPEIRSSSEIYGYFNSGPLHCVPISSILGDQQAALVGQMCLSKGEAKSTYGTGCFLLKNTGKQIIQSEHGLLTTVAYKLGEDAPAFYALEGSVAIAGAALKWLRYNLGIIKDYSEVETLVKSVPDSGGVYFVPAFSGLFAPYWRSDARGIICGLTQHTKAPHIARAAYDAVCFQTKEVLDAMQNDSGIRIPVLKVDGGMTISDTLLQIQSDVAGITVVRPSMTETTALGAAMAAGSAKGIEVWDLKRLSPITTDDFAPSILPEEMNRKYERWCMAVERCLGWELPVEKRPATGTKSEK